MTPPRAPRRLSWAIAGRLTRGVAVAFMLVWLAALIAWPESHMLIGVFRKHDGWPWLYVESVRKKTAPSGGHWGTYFLTVEDYLRSGKAPDGVYGGPGGAYRRDASLHVLWDALSP